MNGGYMTNYFKVSRGVRQGCPLSPFSFVLAVEILALKLCHDPGCTGTITLPNSREARLTQFADDTTVINSFGSFSGLNVNKSETKIMWIGSQKGNKDKLWALSA